MSPEPAVVIDLTSCDREPITRLDLIQNFGFLIALANDWTVVRASANLGNFLGIEAGVAIGSNFAAMTVAGAHEAIRESLRRLQSTDNERLFGIRLVAGQPLFDINLHVVGDILVIEGERSGGENVNEAASMVATMMAKLGRMPALDGFHRLAARQVREISGFDRVMVYRFDPVGNGEVIADATGPGVESFLGLHYPASDIPQQARALYVRNRFRIISDVGETPVALLPVMAANVPALDLSHSITRAQSRVHVEYLTNMGVSATLTISIVVGGELWGLFACHHLAPRLPSFAARTAVELLCGMYSLALESRLNRIAAANEARTNSLTDRLMASVTVNEKLLSDPEWLHAILSEIIDYDGLAVFHDGRIVSLGSTPSDKYVTVLARHLNLTSPSRVFATDNLVSMSMPDAAYPSKAAGVLAIPISRAPRDYILLFRREWVQSIQWGGEPGKFSASDFPLRLSPRKSFAAFAETIIGKARPFSDSDYKIGEAVRRAVVEVILRLSTAATAILTDQLRETSRRNKQLINGVKDYAIYWLDPTGHVESWNDGARAIHGYDETDIVGQYFSVFFEASDRAAGEPEHVLATALRDGKWIGEGWRTRKDGTTFWAEVSVEAVYERAGLLVGFAKVSRDVTERRSLERSRDEAAEEIKDKGEALAISEEKYELTLKGMSVGVWDWDIVSNHLYWSKKFLEILGIYESRLNFTFNDFTDRLHPGDKETTLCLLQNHIDGRTVYDIEYRMRHARGHYIWIHSTGQATWNEAGEPRRMSGSVADVTDFKLQQQALVESEEIFRRAIENAVVGNVLMAPDGRWLTVNRAFCKLVGYEEADLLRTGTKLIQYQGEPWILQETFEALMSGSATIVENERRLRHADGHQLWVNVSASLVTRDGGAMDYLVIQFQDLTERKRSEVMKDEFVSTVSHELRTPLTSLFGSLQLLGSCTAGKLDPRSERLLQVAQISSRQLTTLVNDILDIEKIAAGKADFLMATLAAQPLIAEIIEQQFALADLHRVTFNKQLNVEGLAIRVDPNRFNQALVNLLSNAAKFSPAGDKVHIVAKREGEAAIRISVTDHGPGIPATFRSRIFDRFAQADTSTARKVGGTGLGLNITKSLIEAFGGIVSFDSVEGEGATFHFVLPTCELIANESETEAHD